MASSQGVWGIDIGQCALKALRCTIDEDGESVVADAFDFIEYPKILSQPEADPDELIRDALQQFLSRNDLLGDKVAISVSGQAGLARFIKLPPVESKKIPDIVKYEAKQQIPFPLEEVIWDYEQLKGGSEEEGFTLETEVGLFAMKRDQVFKVIRPFDRAGMELDIIQLAPLSIYNVVCQEFLKDLPAPDEYDPDDPPESVVVISLGTDTTDLVVTNGFRVWQRNIPLGGNHFTRALTKEMKLTFAKAEHLKRNAREAEDPKKVFQAMRPIFNDLVTEVQRSISYFQSIDRKAKIGKVIALGNAMRLPGLQQYLAKNLGYDVMEVTSYPSLGGKGVVAAPAFRDNLLSYAVTYGLCLQGLGKGALSTNLIPRELIIQRMIRDKKPWALATCAALLLGLSFNFFFTNRAWQSVNVESDAYKTAIQAVGTVEQQYNTAKATDGELLEHSLYLKSLGKEVVDNSERRLWWPELFAGVNNSFPYNVDLNDTPNGPATIPLPIKSMAESRGVPYIPFSQREDLHITKVESQQFLDLKTWYSSTIASKRAEQLEALYGAGNSAPPPVKPDDPPPDGNADAVAPADAAAPPAAAEEDADSGSKEAPPEGPGWVVELQGYHDFARPDGRSYTELYIRETIIANLQQATVALPVGPGKTETKEFTMQELGVTHPVIVWNSQRPVGVTIDNPYDDDQPGGNQDLEGGIGSEEEQDSDMPAEWTVERFYFIVQFAWVPNTVSDRIEKIEKGDTQGPDQVASNQTAGGEL